MLTHLRFGGTNGTKWFNDVWTYDPRVNAWSQLDCIGYIPAPREGHSAALVADVMYIFGGRTEEGTDLGDLAAFRITSRRWYTFQNMGPSPSPRSGHSMTAHGKQIIVLGGEPSSAPRDAAELSMGYILDTGKIRYPNDGPQPQGAVQPSSPTRRPSTEVRSGIPTASSRSMSREGQRPPTADGPRAIGVVRDGPPGPSGPPSNRLVESPGPGNSRLPKASMIQGAAGPPPQGQAPTPRANGVVTNARGKAPVTVTGPQLAGGETLRAVPPEAQPTVVHNRELSKENVPPNREISPGNQGRRTPTQHQQTVNKAKAMEAGEAAPLIMSGGSISRQRSLRSQRAHGSIDSSEEGALGRSTSSKHFPDASLDGRSLRSLGDEPRSPKLTPHQEALVKDLEAAKSRNAWYASELALARKAGYHTGSGAGPGFDERAVSQFSDDDRPLIEAFMTMRAELFKMQQTVDQQTTSTAKKIAETEHQRDAAISEAAYARAKLAAHGGSQNSTPLPDGSRDSLEHSERQTDISRRLALALAAQAEHRSKLEAVGNELASERRARELAEESSDTAQRRLDELSGSRNPMEIEALRAELHEAQTTARAETARRTEIENQHRMASLDRDDFSKKHEESSSRLKDHVASLAALEAAVAASTNKAGMYERQHEEEKQRRESSDRKLLQLRSEHEERTRELDTTSRRLKDAEEMAESHAKEATTHREALMAGLQRVASPTDSSSRDTVHEQRLTALQQAADQARGLALSHQEAADSAAQKLRAAEERIAGLEAYQEQSSREGLQMRRQLQTAMRDVQGHQSESRDLKTQLESQQRDASALAVQHGALKDLLGERGINMADARRSPMLDSSPGSRFGTPDQNRYREMESQLQNSLKAHEDTRQAYEIREQEADRAYREKIEQLDNDYQSAVHYVRGTEKMLKKMREELSKYKTQNSELKSELEAVQSTSTRSPSDQAEGHSDWTTERDRLHQSIADMQTQNSSHLAQLEQSKTSIQRELAATQAERDHHRSQFDHLNRSTEGSSRELSDLKSENAMLLERAADAEQKVTLLLDQVGQSVGNYRRQSQLANTPQLPQLLEHQEQSQSHSTAANPISLSQFHSNLSHNRGESVSTMLTDTTSLGDDESAARGTGEHDNRGSLALENLASELETLRSQWSNNASRNYRLSNQFEFERTPTSAIHGGGSSSANEGGGGLMGAGLADWRRKLDEDDHDEEGGNNREIHGHGGTGVGENEDGPATQAAQVAMGGTAATGPGSHFHSHGQAREVEA